MNYEYIFISLYIYIYIPSHIVIYIHIYKYIYIYIYIYSTEPDGDRLTACSGDNTYGIWLMSAFHSHGLLHAPCVPASLNHCSLDPS